METYILISTAVYAYLIGGIMSAVLLTKTIKGFDVREKGSNNAGTTNVIRTSGWKIGGATFVLDVLKGVAAILLAYITHTITGVNIEKLVAVAGIAVIIGHTFPAFFGFKGGKGVATALGVMLMINPTIVGIIFVFCILLVIVTKIVSIASITGAVLLPVLMLFLQNGAINTNLKYITSKNTNYMTYIIFTIILAIIILFNHRSNIVKLKNGQENKLTFGKKKEKEEK